ANTTSSSFTRATSRPGTFQRASSGSMSSRSVSGSTAVRAMSVFMPSRYEPGGPARLVRHANEERGYRNRLPVAPARVVTSLAAAARCVAALLVVVTVGLIGREDVLGAPAVRRVVRAA